MIITIELILELFIAYKLLVEEDYGKLFYYYIAGVVLLYPYFRIVPFCTPNVFLPIVATVRLIKDGTFSSCWQAFPEKKLMLAFLAFIFIQPIMSTRFGYMEALIGGIHDYFGTFYQLFIGFCLAPTYEELVKEKKLLYVTIIIFSIVGIACFNLKDNFVAFGIDDTNIWIDGAGGRGFRSVSTQVSPAIYGMISVALGLLVLQLETNKILLFSMLGLLFTNLICCSTRSPIIELVIGFSAYYIFKGSRQFAKYIFCVLIFIFVVAEALSTIPEVNELLGGVTDIFTTGGENTKGSNVQMRQLQLAASFAYFLQNPIWGNGVLFIGSITAETGKYHNLYNTDLLGSEGYIYYLLIEYGLVYIILIFALTIRLIMRFIQYKKTDTELGALSLAIFAVLATHLLLTRPENAWDVIYPILGVFLFYSYCQEYEEEEPILEDEMESAEDEYGNENI